MIGTVFGHYRVTHKLGQGGVGDVWKAIDLSLDRQVALKVLRPELAAQPDVVARFRAEALALAKLNHPNIATIHGFHVEGACPFMVMEYVHGQTLHAVVRGFGRMGVQRAVPLFVQVLDGIQHAHEQGIVHRDLKASNVMLSQLGMIKVLDFGIARRLGSVHLTRGSHSVGTPAWMAPEQVRGEDTDVRTDVYALGLLLYWLVTARLPFEGENEFAVQRAHLEQEPPSPRAFAADLPRGIEKAVLRALAKQRAQRFASVAELRLGLGEGYEPDATRPLPVDVPSEPGRWRDADDELTHLTDAPPGAAGSAASPPPSRGSADEPAPAPTRVLEGARPPAGAAPPDGAGALTRRPAAEPAATGGAAPPAPARVPVSRGAVTSPRTPDVAARRTPAVATGAGGLWLAWAAAALLAVCVALGFRAAAPDHGMAAHAARTPSHTASDAAWDPSLATPATLREASPAELPAAASPLAPPVSSAESAPRDAAFREQGRGAPAATRKARPRARKDSAWVIRRD